MLTRDFLDEVLPGDDVTRRLSERLSGLDLSKDVIGRGLRWLADLQEADKSGEFEDDAPYWWRSLTVSGLGYKGSDSYMTAEGWPLRTCCWVIMVTMGPTLTVAAETPELAVQRAVVVTALFMRQRPIEPSKRERIHDILRAARDEQAAC